MTHELKAILEAYQKFKNQHTACVLATVVALEGSSYRRPGVCMLIAENGKSVGAVSGGCVENEIVHQAHSVFQNGMPKVITYDGRYRLGCEGTLFILIEPFCPTEVFIEQFQSALVKRKSFSSASYFSRTQKESPHFGTVFQFEQGAFCVNNRDLIDEDSDLEVFKQSWKPCFQLFIFGSEHDAVALCEAAARLGWEVSVVASPNEAKTEEFFPGIHRLIYAKPEDFDYQQIHPDAALMLMNHSYARDFHFLMGLRSSRFAYLGLLGPKRRREKLLNELINHSPELDPAFLDNIHGPAGLHIGAETAFEIAVSILAEVLAYTRNVKVKPLKEKTHRIHSPDA